MYAHKHIIAFLVMAFCWWQCLLFLAPFLRFSHWHPSNRNGFNCCKMRRERDSHTHTRSPSMGTSEEFRYFFIFKMNICLQFYHFKMKGKRKMAFFFVSLTYLFAIVCDAYRLNWNETEGNGKYSFHQVFSLLLFLFCFLFYIVQMFIRFSFACDFTIAFALSRTTQ